MKNYNVTGPQATMWQTTSDSLSHTTTKGILYFKLHKQQKADGGIKSSGFYKCFISVLTENLSVKVFSAKL
jgi:hypothetical protein